MKSASKVPEKFLHEIWRGQSFIKELTTSDGRPVKIIDPGIENRETGGPDFKEAKIKIGNLIFTGDVEVDSSPFDWKGHGHNINKSYNGVILHVVFQNDDDWIDVCTSGGRKVPIVAIKDSLKSNLRKILHDAILNERKNRINKMPCAGVTRNLGEKEKLDFIHHLGIERYRSKCSRLLERLKELAYLKELKLKEPVIKYELDENFYNKTFSQRDFCEIGIWQQLFYESVFEALGYSMNKDVMKALAKAVDISFFSPYIKNDNFQNIIEAVLFNVSGLIPQCTKITDGDTAEYIRKLYEMWNGIKINYDGIIFTATQWNFAKQRPQNFPTVRIAGGAKIIFKILKEGLIERIFKKVEIVGEPGKLICELRDLLLVSGKGFWKNHFVFDQISVEPVKFFIGTERVDELLINVVFPFASIYFEIFGRKDLSKKVVRLYLNYNQKGENNLVNEISSNLLLSDACKRSVIYQGMLELFRSYCSLERCLECSIGMKVFR